MNRNVNRRTALGSSGLRRLFIAAGLALVAASSTARASEPCGTGTYPFPYTDVASVGDGFCPGIMEAYVTGISRGTTPTTFSPNDTVIRSEMTTFLQRTFDQGLARSSRRAALEQWWTPQTPVSLQTILLPAGSPQFCKADGSNIWVTTLGATVVQLDAGTGNNLNHWAGATAAAGVLVAAGKVFAVGATSGGGSLYVLDPTQLPAGSVTLAAGGLGGPSSSTIGLAFDGTNIWTTNYIPPGSLSIITPGPSTPYAVSTLTSGAISAPNGILFDGTSIWVTDFLLGTVLKIDPTTNGILVVTPVGTNPGFPAFDGANIWVPNTGSNSVSVVQASTGTLVATIASGPKNKLNQPSAASFDGERVLVTNEGNNTVTVFKAADLSFIANVSTGPLTPTAACSDGINFWIDANDLLRF
jgi:YVTN family beta-propeller protein